MSRCSIKPKQTDKPITEVVVGLDRPLGSWFFQVFIQDEDGEESLLVNEWCNNYRAIELIDQWGDVSDMYTNLVRKHIGDDFDPAQRMGLPQNSSWDKADCCAIEHDNSKFKEWLLKTFKEIEEKHGK